MGKKNKKKNKTKVQRSDQTAVGTGSSSGNEGTSKTSKQNETSSSKTSSKKSNKKSGSKKTKKEAQRIKDQLKIAEQKGLDKAKSIKDKKIERSPKNLGDKGQKGEAKRKETQKRGNKLISKKNKKNDPLKKGELLNAERFGPLENQYKKAMKKIGDVTKINQRLDKSLKDLKISNKKDRTAFNNESLKNQKLLTSMQQSSARQLADMEESARDDRALYKQQISALDSQYSRQNDLVAEQQRLQQIQERKARNLENAYVPNREDSLASVRYGDNRKRKRRDKDNRLSDLRINTGLASAASSAAASVAGLQLA